MITTDYSRRRVARTKETGKDSTLGQVEPSRNDECHQGRKSGASRICPPPSASPRRPDRLRDLCAPSWPTPPTDLLPHGTRSANAVRFSLTDIQRRSKDGFVSATGMFKIAFPWAQHSEEREERDYLKTLETTSEDDVAGNIWVTPEFGTTV